MFGSDVVSKLDPADGHELAVLTGVRYVVVLGLLYKEVGRKVISKIKKNISLNDAKNPLFLSFKHITNPLIYSSQQCR